MPEIPEIPERLNRTLDMLDLVPDRSERIQLLIDVAERFEPAPARLAPRPFPEESRVPACESEAFVFAEERADGTLDYHFAVENPQGISAKAMAVLLREGLSGAPLERVAAVPEDVIYRVFGRELSMGKSMGLMGMVTLAKTLARRRLAAGTERPAT